MSFKYMVKGKVKSGFIIRGFYNQVGSEITLYLFEDELEFVKDRCDIVSITELDKEPALPESILEPEEEKKEVEIDELQSKQTGGKNKAKRKTGV